jgi:hypothetical protein
MTANERISKLHFYHNIVAKKCTTVTVYSPFIYLFKHQVTIILFISSFKHYKIPLFSQCHFLVSLHELYELNISPHVFQNQSNDIHKFLSFGFLAARV